MERLAAPADDVRAPDLETVIAAQIQRIVAARVLESGEGELSLLEFGMPNVVDVNYNSKTALERYAARLTRMIRHYEPRLLEPRVAVEGAASTLSPYRLVVTGRLAPDGDVRSFLFELPEH